MPGELVKTLHRRGLTLLLSLQALDFVQFWACYGSVFLLNWSYCYFRAQPIPGFACDNASYGQTNEIYLLLKVNKLNYRILSGFSWYMETMTADNVELKNEFLKECLERKKIR